MPVDALAREAFDRSLRRNYEALGVSADYALQRKRASDAKETGQPTIGPLDTYPLLPDSLARAVRNLNILTSAGRANLANAIRSVSSDPFVPNYFSWAGEPVDLTSFISGKVNPVTAAGGLGGGVALSLLAQADPEFRQRFAPKPPSPVLQGVLSVNNKPLDPEIAFTEYYQRLSPTGDLRKGRLDDIIGRLSTKPEHEVARDIAKTKALERILDVLGDSKVRNVESLDEAKRVLDKIARDESITSLRREGATVSDIVDDAEQGAVSRIDIQTAKNANPHDDLAANAAQQAANAAKVESFEKLREVASRYYTPTQQKVFEMRVGGKTGQLPYTPTFGQKTTAEGGSFKVEQGTYPTSKLAGEFRISPRTARYKNTTEVPQLNKDLLAADLDPAALLPRGSIDATDAQYKQWRSDLRRLYSRTELDQAISFKMPEDSRNLLRAVLVKDQYQLGDTRRTYGEAAKPGNLLNLFSELYKHLPSRDK